MRSIGVLIKPASGLCNMRCDYCFYADETANRQISSYGIMTRQTLKNVIRRTLLPCEGAYSIAFQGGEPTLAGLDFFREAVRLINQYNRHDVPVQLAIQTNGYQIDEEWAAFLAEHHFLVGISVDGTKQIHDLYRHGSDGTSATYDQVLKTTELFSRYHVDYNILTVVTEQTAAHAREIYDNNQKNGWHFLQFITCLDPLGEARGQSSYSLKPASYGKFLCDLFDLWEADVQKGIKQRENPLAFAPYIRTFDNYVAILSGRRPESCEQTGICRMDESTYVVEADGSVYPCDFYVLDAYRAGNFNEDRIDAVDQKMKALGFTERSRTLPSECQSCRYLSLCRGGCYRSRLTNENGLDETLQADGRNYFCESFRMFFDHSQERLKKIADFFTAWPRFTMGS